MQRAHGLAAAPSSLYPPPRDHRPRTPAHGRTIIPPTERAFLALGSNIGDREATLDAAVEALGEEAGRVVAASTRHETPALLPPGAPPDWDIPFLNQVIAVDTALSPRTLLDVAKAIETRLGRAPSARWAPRVIDVDILAVGALTVDEPGLTIPHPELHRRLFVLDPWSEIAPEWRHPIRGETVAAMRARLAEAT